MRKQPSADRLSRERRSWNMSRIRGKDTTPEKAIRSLLHRMGYRFRLHTRIPITGEPADCAKTVGRKRTHSTQRISLSSSNEERVWVRRRSPRAVSVDILLPRYRTVIFVHGCFWHRHRGCVNCTTPTHRREWWLAKLNGNAARDQRHQAALRKLGWHPIVVWECETEKPKSLEKVARRLAKRLR
jgi:DNA mismatch endonuclease (patch repair protein)